MPDLLRTLIAKWRAEADELDAATNGTWIEPSVKRNCADELVEVLTRLPHLADINRTQTCWCGARPNKPHTIR